MSKQATWAVVAFVAGLTIGFFAGRIGQKPQQALYRERPETTIVLRMVSGTCTPSDPLPLVRKKNQDVTWRFQNECAEPYDVQLKTFRPKREDGSYGDAENDVVADREPRGTIGTGGGAITARIAKIDVPDDGIRYKYEIWLAPQGQTLRLGRDPDLEIWP